MDLWDLDRDDLHLWQGAGQTVPRDAVLHHQTTVHGHGSELRAEHQHQDLQHHPYRDQPKFHRVMISEML